MRNPLRTLLHGSIKTRINKHVNYVNFNHAVNKIPDDSELGEKLIDLCLVILGKAVKLTKTDMDDKLLETVKAALATRD